MFFAHGSRIGGIPVEAPLAQRIGLRYGGAMRGATMTRLTDAVRTARELVRELLARDASRSVPKTASTGALGSRT